MFFYIKHGNIVMEFGDRVNFTCDQIIEKETRPGVSYIFEDGLIKDYKSSRLYLETHKIAGKDKRIQELVKENQEVSKKYDKVLVSYNDVLADSGLNQEPSNVFNAIKDYSLGREPHDDFERAMLETRALLLNQ